MPTSPPDLSYEITRTHPDHVLYNPGTLDTTLPITGNEHLLVSRLDPQRLFAVWTQSSFEAAPDQHIVTAVSHDDGESWSAPVIVAGPDSNGHGMASWAFPLLSESGRIYLLYFRHQGVDDIFTHTTGALAGIYSDDHGTTWSGEEMLEAAPASIWGNATDPAMPPNCIIWQKPQRQSRGKYFVGLTRWVSPKAELTPPLEGTRSVVEFVRFENVDDDPEVSELRLTWLCGNEAALRIDGEDLQEPAIVTLPDGRLFVAMRSSMGSPYWAVSADSGDTWSLPEPLRWHDAAPPIPHPLSPCPMFQVDDETLVFLFHNHDGTFLGYGPKSFEPHRRPVCIARGDFEPDAVQPLVFSEPEYWMDSGGVFLKRQGLSLYSSITRNQTGDLTLWYPDRKFFLLGRRIDRRGLSALPLYDRPGT